MNGERKRKSVYTSKLHLLTPPSVAGGVYPARTEQFISTKKLDLHAIQLRGGATENNKSCQVSVFSFVCPGPGDSWGNLTVLPASKDAESPSPLFYSILFYEWGG